MSEVRVCNHHACVRESSGVAVSTLALQHDNLGDAVVQNRTTGDNLGTYCESGAIFKLLDNISDLGSVWVKKAVRGLSPPYKILLISPLLQTYFVIKPGILKYLRGPGWGRICVCTQTHLWPTHDLRPISRIFLNSQVDSIVLRGGGGHAADDTSCQGMHSRSKLQALCNLRYHSQITAT